jgi:hypothetical protein
MGLRLAAGKLKDLRAIWLGCMPCPRLGVVVGHDAVSAGLFDIAIEKVHNGLSIGEDLCRNERDERR